MYTNADKSDPLMRRLNEVMDLKFSPPRQDSL